MLTMRGKVIYLKVHKISKTEIPNDGEKDEPQLHRRR